MNKKGEICLWQYRFVLAYEGVFSLKKLSGVERDPRRPLGGRRGGPSLGCNGRRSGARRPGRSLRPRAPGVLGLWEFRPQEAVHGSRDPSRPSTAIKICYAILLIWYLPPEASLTSGRLTPSPRERATVRKVPLRIGGCSAAGLPRRPDARAATRQSFLPCYPAAREILGHMR